MNASGRAWRAAFQPQAETGQLTSSLRDSDSMISSTSCSRLLPRGRASLLTNVSPRLDSSSKKKLSAHSELQIKYCV